MRRLYYLANDLETTHAVSDALHAEGINDWHFHVLANDEAGLLNHKIHAATIYQQLDVLHTGPRWAIIGGLAGLTIGVVAFTSQPLPWATSLFDVFLMMMVGGFFGAWQGGMVGLSRESYKVAPFHDAIESGRYLLLIDTPAKQSGQVRDLMRSKFSQVEEAGSDSTLINPFRSPRKVHHQTTH